MDFVEIDLTEGDEKSHPAFNEEGYFLVERIGINADGHGYSNLHFGQFRKVWFGWHFACDWGASGGFQYNQPGSNHSSWGRCWRLKGYQRPLLEDDEDLIQRRIAEREMKEDCW